MPAKPQANKTARPRSAGAVTSRSVLVLNGPNLNLLGSRQPEVYGAATLRDIEMLCARTAAELGLTVVCRQSNHEGELIELIHAARGVHRAIVINPAAYGHTSVALLDALLACDLPVFEVHISNIHRRDEFRHHSYVARAAVGVICGCGILGYDLALRAAASLS